MARKKYPHTYTDAKGNTIVQFADGNSEMYIGGRDRADRWLDVTNEADIAVGRKRFLPDVSAPTTIHTRDESLAEEGVPGIDGLEDDDDN